MTTKEKAMNLLNYVRDKLAEGNGRIAELTRASEQHRKEYVLYSAVVGEMESAGVPDAVVEGYRDKANAAMTGIGDASMEIERLKVRLEVLRELEPVVAARMPRERKFRSGTKADRIFRALQNRGGPMSLEELAVGIGHGTGKKAELEVQSIIARYLRIYFKRSGPKTYSLVQEGGE